MSLFKLLGHLLVVEMPLLGLVRGLGEEDLGDVGILLLQRPPFLIDAEAALVAGHRISHLVTKNAGGHETEAKLMAARQARIPVIMVERPVKTGVPTFSTSGELIAVLRGMLSP